MDPVSLGVSIVTLVHLAVKAISLASSYVASAKDAKSSISRLVVELEALKSNLSGLQTLLDGNPARFHQSSAISACSATCKTVLDNLCRRLENAGDGDSLWILWPLKEKEHEKTIRDIRALVSYIHLALTIDGSWLLSRSLDDVLAVLDQMNELKSLKRLVESTNDLADSLITHDTLAKQKQDLDCRNKVFEWLSVTNYSHRHNTIVAGRVEGTGCWLLETPQFRSWIAGGMAPNLLWCHGIHGSGKTVLASVVIDHLREVLHQAEENVAVAYWYFNYQETDLQSPVTVLSSILRQILESLPTLPRTILDAYQQHLKLRKEVTLQTLIQLCADVIGCTMRSYVIIDALDECENARHRSDLLVALRRLSQLPNGRVLVTSREHQSDVSSDLKAATQITIRAHESDLRRYLHEELKHAESMDVISESFAAIIAERIIQKADGMFLLAVLQLRAVLGQPTMGDMEDALSTLSSTLPEAFDETVSRIKRLPESRQRLAFTALLWVCQNRQITVAAVTEALSVRIGQNTIDEKYRPSVGTILDCCQGLVTVDKATTSSSFYDRQRMAEAADGDILRPVHQSVKEFFFSHRDQFLPNADAMLAEICLTYLILRKFPCGPCFTGPEIEARVARYPFLRYAANSWGYYVRVSQHDPRVRQLLEQFLDCRDEVASMSQISDYFLRYTEKYWSREEVYSLNALHVLCDEMVGPEDIVRDVLASGRFPVNAASSIGTTPLLKAVSGGNVSLVHLLIEYGADPFLANWYGNALDCAAEGGQAAVARELVLRHGMPLQRLANRHPLGCALDRDCDEVFEVLVDLGADLNAPVSRNMSVKAMAFLLGCERIVELMLRRSWLGDANEVVGDGMRPLHLAILGGSSAIVSSLVKAGADVDATTSTGVSALQLAAIHGNGELAAMLLEAGARPLAMGQENGYKAYLVEVYEDSEVDEDSEKD